MQNKTWIPAAMLACGAVLAGCDYSPEYKIATAQPAEETFRDFGDYEVHYNAVRTDILPPDVARAYGIQRSANRVMLNVTVLHKEAEHAARTPVDAEVEVDAYNLNGQLKNIDVRRVSEGDAIYYIGEVTIAGAEILVFDISVQPQDVTAPFEVKFKRQFYSD